MQHLVISSAQPRELLALTVHFVNAEKAREIRFFLKMKITFFLPALALGVANRPFEPPKEPVYAVWSIRKCKTLSDFSISEYRDCLNYFTKPRCRWIGRFGVFKILIEVHR